MDTVFQIAKKAESNLLNSQPIKIGKYATHDHVEKISRIDAYLNSQHTSGPTDSLGREKPFFNIALIAAYTWYKLTNIDRKNIRFTPAKSKQRLKALIATIRFRKWMNDKKFGDFLNKWGWTLAKYGSAVTKFVEKEGKLIPTVVSWDRMICDPVDFEGNPKIEKLFFTPAQLREQPYDQEMIEDAIEAHKAIIRENISGEHIDIKNEYIGIYELHGNLPMAVLKQAKGEEWEEEDETIYRQQMHVLFMEDNPQDKDNPYRISLYSGREKKDPYDITHLIEQEGRTLSVGAVETIFDPQWMVNHFSKQAKDQLELASKLLIQTSDQNFLGRNTMTDIETGGVLIHQEGKPLTQVNTQSHDIPQITGNLDMWKGLARELAGSHEAVTGEQPPSGTPYSLQAMLSTEARGLFNMMRQNKGLALEEMLKKHVLPYFKRELSKSSDEIITTLDGEDLENFDNLTLPTRLERELMASLSIGIPTREHLMRTVNGGMEESVRVIRPSMKEDKTWGDYFKDFDINAVEVEITGENRDKQTIITTLDTILQRMMSNPEALQDPNIKKVFNKIIDEIGPGILSPLQLSDTPPMEGATGGIPRGEMSPIEAGQVGVSEGIM